MKLVAFALVAACSSHGSSHGPVSNQAPPSAPDAAIADSNTVNGRIIRFEKVGTDQILTINKGSSDGIERSWHVKLVLDNGASVVEVTLIRIDKTTSMLKTMGPVPVDVARTTVHFEKPIEDLLFEEP